MKGIYFTWTNDPPNTKIKDWNVTELKVRPSPLPLFPYDAAKSLIPTRADRPAPPTRRQVRRSQLLEDARRVDFGEQTVACQILIRTLEFFFVVSVFCILYFFQFFMLFFLSFSASSLFVMFSRFRFPGTCHP